MAADRTNQHRFKWASEPPPKQRPEIPLIRVKAGRSYKAVIVSDRVEGLLVHFIGGRTRACIGKADNCEGCASGWNPRWKGYIAVFFPDHSRRVYLAELTPKAYEALEASRIPEESYRGCWVRVERASGRANAPVTASIVATAKYADEIPEIPDVRSAVAYILEAPDRKEGTTPPTVNLY